MRVLLAILLPFVVACAPGPLAPSPSPTLPDPPVITRRYQPCVPGQPKLPNSLPCPWL